MKSSFLLKVVDQVEGILLCEKRKWKTCRWGKTEDLQSWEIMVEDQLLWIQERKEQMYFMGMIKGILMKDLRVKAIMGKERVKKQ